MYDGSPDLPGPQVFAEMFLSQIKGIARIADIIDQQNSVAGNFLGKGVPDPGRVFFCAYRGSVLF